MTSVPSGPSTPVGDDESTPDAGELPPLDLTPRTSGGDGEVTGRRGRQGRSATGYVAVIVIVLLIGATFFVVKALGGATLYFYQANEAVAQRQQLGEKRFRLFGAVVPGSVQRTADGVTFDVTYEDVKVPVRHVGDPPQLFQPGIPVVLEGHWTADGTAFASDRILVKHSEEYVEKNPDRKTSADDPQAGQPAPAGPSGQPSGNPTP